MHHFIIEEAGGRKTAPEEIPSQSCAGLGNPMSHCGSIQETRHYAPFVLSFPALGSCCWPQSDGDQPEPGELLQTDLN